MDPVLGGGKCKGMWEKVDKPPLIESVSAICVYDNEVLEGVKSKMEAALRE